MSDDKKIGNTPVSAPSRQRGPQKPIRILTDDDGIISPSLVVPGAAAEILRRRRDKRKKKSR